MELDKDLRSIQEVRDLIAASKAAQKIYAGFEQARMDAICEAVVRACEGGAERLAKMANEETGFGRWEDKVLKNLLGSRICWETIKNERCVGILRELPEQGIIEIGVPMGVVAAIIPSTNPTSTVMYKTLIALKSGNGIVISPHPGAKNCILATFELVRSAAEAAGAPKGLIGCISEPTIEASGALMKHRDVGVILATGGEGMVRAAYSSGNPAIGVGPGNGSAYIERSADIPLAVKHVMDSKTFDNGTICASEQSIVTESCIRGEVEAELRRQGAYFLNDEESAKVGRFLLRENGTMNPKIVGKPATYIAKMAGVTVPADTRVLVSLQTEVSRKNPYSREKLCPVLGYYVEEDWERACERCIAILQNEGVGHTMTIHTRNSAVVREFALKKPVGRLLVNTPGALGGVGATTNLAPAMTLGCGAIGKSATSDNITPMNLINIRRVAYGMRELEDLKNGVPRSAAKAPDMHEQPANSGFTGLKTTSAAPVASSGDRAAIEQITRSVIEQLLKRNS